MPRGPAFTDWQILEGLRLRDAGYTYQQIADDLGRTQSAWWTRLARIKAEQKRTPDRSRGLQEET